MVLWMRAFLPSNKYFSFVDRATQPLVITVNIMPGIVTSRYFASQTKFLSDTIDHS